MKRWRRFKTETLERAAYFVTIVGFPLLFFSALVVTYQLVEARRVASSQNNIALNTLFFTDTNIGIFSAIEDGKLILKEHKGEYRAGPGCLNRFSASISGASTKVRLPSGGAAA